jgi:hypothetical protein
MARLIYKRPDEVKRKSFRIVSYLFKMKLTVSFLYFIGNVIYVCIDIEGPNENLSFISRARDFQEIMTEG